MVGSSIREISGRLNSKRTGDMPKVLFVEEDRADLVYYLGILRTLGHRVVVASSYSHALALLDGERFDLIVVGQGGPAFDGRAVVIRALEKNPGVPVVVVARSLDIDCYLEAMDLGAADYLEKSASPREFMRVADSYLQAESAA